MQKIDTFLLRMLQNRRAFAATGVLLFSLIPSGCGDAGDNADSKASAPSSASSSASAPIIAPIPASNSPADQAWNAFKEAFGKPPEPPVSWATEPPDEAAMNAFRLTQGESAAKVADLALDFYTRFASDSRVAEARWNEIQLLDFAVKRGVTNVLGRLEGLEKARVTDPSISDDERFAILMSGAQRSAELLFAQGGSAKDARASLEKSARQMIRDFPQRPEPYHMLLSMLGDQPPETQRATATSLISTNVPEDVRMAAQALLKKLELAGQPLDLKFTAVDGREVNLAQLRGKVVLVDFWATWCGPCIEELPNVKSAYERLHPKGFEIIGISFDQKKDVLVKFVEDQQMPWPQYFDGKGWENEIGQRFGIDGIPAMWLVDHEGVLRDLSAREDLEAKIQRLLDAAQKK